MHQKADDRRAQFWFLEPDAFQQLEKDFALVEEGPKEQIKAKRFDFVFNSTYYVLNARVNYGDCRMEGRTRYSHGRVISQRPIKPNPGAADEDGDGPMKISDVPLSK